MNTQKTLDFRSHRPLAVALGCFDGVHEGHRRLICETNRIAREKSVDSAVFCFSEPPKNYFFPNSTPTLTSFEEKQRLMSALSPDILICVDFCEEIAEMSAERFFEDIVKNKLNATEVVCGFNYRFGKGGAGDADLLAKLCADSGIGLTVIPKISIDGVAVSSSEIRRLLGAGDVSAAAKLLGRHYSINSPVVDGQHLGRTLGFPTINQLFDSGSTPLRHGVYATRAHIGDEVKGAITNVGVRPTVDGHTLCAETNIFDFESDLYGKSVQIEFVEFIRPEQKFDSVDELKIQVLADIEKAKKCIL